MVFLLDRIQRDFLRLVERRAQDICMSRTVGYSMETSEFTNECDLLAFFGRRIS
jgi:hypothetical protein